MLAGVGGRTIEEAKERLSFEETLAWAAYMRQRGSLHVGMRLEVGFELLANGASHRCAPRLANHVVPRELFRVLAPGRSVTMTVLLTEACDGLPLDRPGLYEVRASLELPSTGTDVGLAAYTGVAVAAEPTLLRIRRGRAPFYGAPPHPELRTPATPAQDFAAPAW